MLPIELVEQGDEDGGQLGVLVGLFVVVEDEEEGETGLALCLSKQLFGGQLEEGGRQGGFREDSED